jgi:hypothetical protein
MTISEETIELVAELSKIREQQIVQKERIEILEEKLDMVRKSTERLSRREAEISHKLSIEQGKKKPAQKDNLSQVLGTLFSTEETTLLDD